MYTAPIVQSKVLRKWGNKIIKDIFPKTVNQSDCPLMYVLLEFKMIFKLCCNCHLFSTSYVQPTECGERLSLQAVLSAACSRSASAACLLPCLPAGQPTCLPAGLASSCLASRQISQWLLSVISPLGITRVGLLVRHWCKNYKIQGFEKKLKSVSFQLPLTDDMNKIIWKI